MMTQFYTKPHISLNFAFPWLVGVDKAPIHLMLKGWNIYLRMMLGLHPFIPTMTVHVDSTG